MGKLAGKVAVIAGGSSGIGLATAKLFVSEGAYVFIMGRRQRELDRAVKETGVNVAGVRGDIGKLADLDRLYEAVKTKGRIDIFWPRMIPVSSRVSSYSPMAVRPKSDDGYAHLH